MTIEEALQTVAAAGLRVTNLFQLDDGIWQANITNGAFNSEFARDPSPAGALIGALYNYQNQGRVPVRTYTSRTSIEAPAAAGSARDLL